MYLKLFITLLFLNSLTLFAETVGDASWYGEKFQGKPTASGEPFDMYAYTAAHRTLPFGTILTVTNLSNNKSVEVRVNDRGPFKENRIVDLSYKAAKEIGIVQEGVSEVSIEEKTSKSSVASVSSSQKKKVAQKVPCDDEPNPYLTDNQESTMQEYAMRTPAPDNSYSSKDEYTQGDTSNQEVKVQVAAFSSEINAKTFINAEEETGFNMKVINVFSDNTNKTLYKVVILCDSKVKATKIINSKQYNGAYIFYQ